MRAWSSLGQRRKLGAHTMEMFSRPILVWFMLSAVMKFWWGVSEGEERRRGRERERGRG